MDQIIQVLATGLSQGGVYALVGLGFSLVNMATRVLNLSQGSYAMLGGLMFLTFVSIWELDFWVAFGLVLVIIAALGVLTERIVNLRTRPWRPVSIDMAVLSTLALVVVFEGASFLIWGADPQRGPAVQRGVFEFMGAIIVWQSVWMFGAAIVIAVALHLFLHKTWTGRAMRACSQNPLTGALLGINVRRVGTVAFVLSAMIGAVAGILVSPITWLEYQVGGYFMLKGILAYLLGGEEDVAGPVAGGIFLGLIENIFLLVPGTTGGLLKQVVPMAALIVILVWRPQGLFNMSKAR
jgi:branched-chain amino acid transport system permease protein